MGGGVRRLAAGLAFGRTAEESVRLDPGQALESGENGLEVRGRIGHVPACGSGGESGVRQGPRGVVERVPVRVEAQEDEAFFPVEAVFEVQGEGHGWLVGVRETPDLRIVAAFKVRVAHMDAIGKRILKPAHQFVGQVWIKEQHG